MTLNNEKASSKRVYIAGTLPARRNTVTSAVLADLLESNVLTGMHSVFNQSTTRLSAVVHSLERSYGWTIERRDVATGTKDGRVAWITAYWLSRITVEQAFAAGARDWIDGVKAARAKQSQQANICKAAAAHINAPRKKFKSEDPRQGGLWGDL